MKEIEWWLLSGFASALYTVVALWQVLGKLVLEYVMKK